MMKKILSIILLLVTCNFFGQRVHADSVPASVKSAFNTLYKGATPISWEKEKFNLYNVEFKWEGKATYATFNPNGLLMRTAILINTRELNKDIVKHAHELYPDYKLKQALKITTVDKKIFYQLRMKKEEDIKNLVFQESGFFMGEDIYETMNEKTK